mgnify:CR=1 FL=1
MAQIAKVVAITGEVIVVGLDGQTRVLKVGDVIENSETLRTLAEQWHSLGLRTCLRMVPEPGQTYPPVPGLEVLAQSIDYPSNIDSINRARCLLEITQANQSGLTVRCLEALFFDKKLITNNPCVRTLPFYNPARFFILGQDDPQALTAFLQAPIPPLPKGALQPYDFAHWVRQFDHITAPARA